MLVRGVLGLLVFCLLPACSTAPSMKGGAKPRVIIIGAGVSGLAAAHALKDKAEVVVLEARDRVGGRVATFRDPSGLTLDLGASFIHGIEGNPVYQLSRSAGIGITVLNDEEWPTTFEGRGRLLSDEEREAIDDEYESVLKEVRDLQRREIKRPDVSLLSQLDRVIAKRKLSVAKKRSFWHLIQSEIVSEYAADPFSLSFRSWDEDDALQGDDALFLKGYDQFPQLLSRGVDIRFERKVTLVDWSRPTIEVSTAGGERFSAEQIIVTVPVSVLQKGSIQFKPGLPEWKRKAIQKIRMGKMSKVFLVFPKKFWPDRSPWIEWIGEDPKVWPLFIDVSLVSGRPTLLAFAAGVFADKVESMKEPAVQASAMQALKAMFGAQVPDPVRVVRTQWGLDPFSLGAYSFLPTGSRPQDRELLGQPIEDRIFFAGEAMHSRFPSTVHGAYESGLAAARRVVRVPVRVDDDSEGQEKGDD